MMCKKERSGFLRMIELLSIFPEEPGHQRLANQGATDYVRPSTSPKQEVAPSNKVTILTSSR